MTNLHPNPTDLNCKIRNRRKRILDGSMTFLFWTVNNLPTNFVCGFRYSFISHIILLCHILKSS